MAENSKRQEEESLGKIVEFDPDFLTNHAISSNYFQNASCFLLQFLLVTSIIAVLVMINSPKEDHKFVALTFLIVILLAEDGVRGFKELRNNQVVRYPLQKVSRETDQLLSELYKEKNLKLDGVSVTFNKIESRTNDLFAIKGDNLQLSSRLFGHFTSPELRFLFLKYLSIEVAKKRYWSFGSIWILFGYLMLIACIVLPFALLAMNVHNQVNSGVDSRSYAWQLLILALTLNLLQASSDWIHYRRSDLEAVDQTKNFDSAISANRKIADIRIGASKIEGIVLRALLKAKINEIQNHAQSRIAICEQKNSSKDKLDDERE